MTRLFAIVMTCLGLLTLPASAAAFWLQSEGACTVGALASEVEPEVNFTEVDRSIFIATGDCDDVPDPTDASNNLCFELAEHPISTLPDLIAQTQAERTAAQLLSQTLTLLPPALTEIADTALDLSTPDKVKVAKPRNLPSSPNACAVYPDTCETAPVIPTLQLDGTPHANVASGELDLPPPAIGTSRCVPTGVGKGPAAGVVSRLDRPPQFR